MIERHRLSNRHQCESFTFELDGLRFTASVGRFSDGRVGELFLNKSGNQSDTNARDAAILLSFALQHGAVDQIRKALCRNSAGRALGPIGQALDILAGKDGEP
jgi:ribonucleoside-diphosphate reductase alpha chain